MMFTRRLREGIRRGRIRCTVRIWKNLRVKVGGRYPMDDGHVVVDSIEPIRMNDITAAVARESGFASLDDLLRTARHGSGDQVFLIRFHYLAPGAWDSSRDAGAALAGDTTLLQRIRRTPAPRRSRRTAKSARAR